MSKVFHCGIFLLSVFIFNIYREEREKKLCGIFLLYLLLFLFLLFFVITSNRLHKYGCCFVANSMGWWNMEKLFVNIIGLKHFRWYSVQFFFLLCCLLILSFIILRSQLFFSFQVALYARVCMCRLVCFECVFDIN